MKIIRTHYDKEMHNEIIRLEKEIAHASALLRHGHESEGYKGEIIKTQRELLYYKDEIIEKLRGQLEELKLQ